MSSILPFGHKAEDLELSYHSNISEGDTCIFLTSTNDIIVCEGGRCFKINYDRSQISMEDSSAKYFIMLELGKMDTLLYEKIMIMYLDHILPRQVAFD